MSAEGDDYVENAARAVEMSVTILIYSTHWLYSVNIFSELHPNEPPGGISLPIS